MLLSRWCSTQTSNVLTARRRIRRSPRLRMSSATRCGWCSAIFPSRRSLRTPTRPPRPRRAAEGAKAAASHGRFWEMASLLYENQEELDDHSLGRYARKAGLDLKRFKKELSSGAHAARVRADYLGGVRSGVNGTPPFFINGKRYEGPFKSEALVAALLNESRGVHR